MNLFELFTSGNIPVIAEIGVNHEGSFSKAKEMIVLAAEAGATFVKFQSFTPERYVAANNIERLQKVTNFALTAANFKELKKIADSLNVVMLSTPVTEDWVDTLALLCPAFKIASGDITFKPVIKKAAKMGKPIIMSTGAATLAEIDQAVNWIKEEIAADNLKNNLALMHCVSAYPTPINQANILSIPFLKKRYGLYVGYSNHVIGMNACLGAVALGADIIEVHFTDSKTDRTFRDHALSFDKDDLSQFIKIAKDIKSSLGIYDKKPQKCESKDINMMRKGIIASKDLIAGKILEEQDLMYARPATEFSSNQIESLIGKTIKNDISKGYLITEELI